LQILINGGFIDATNFLDVSADDILGIASQNTMKFAGRSLDRIVSSIFHNLTTSNLDRCELLFVNGCSGVGKTRYVVEACKSPQLKNVLKFAVTFNNHTELNDLDLVLFSEAQTSHIPLSLRLLFSYARRTDSLFENWCGEILTRKLVPKLKGLHPTLVINWLVVQIVSQKLRSFEKTFQEKIPVLVVVDESLMAWNSFQARNSSIEKITWNMMRSLYKFQGFMPDRSFSLCVVFSALNNRPFLREGGPTPSNFPITHFNLDPIENDDAKSVLIAHFERNPHLIMLIKSFHMTLHAFVTRIVQCVGTLSRALEIVISVCDLSKEHPIYHFRDLIFRVSQKIASRYPLPIIYSDQLFAETLLGIPIQKMTALHLLRHSFVCETHQLEAVPSEPLNNAGIVVKFNTTQLLSYAINLVKRRNTGRCTQFQSILAETFEAISESHSAHNIFEEVYRYRLFLQLHYLQTFHSQSGRVVNGSSLFSPSSSKRVNDFCALPINFKVRVYESQIKSRNPISAQNCQLNNETGLAHFLTAPADPLEPAVDTILYLRQATLLIVYGIQLKYSILWSAPVNMRSLKKASLTFFNRMTFLGHKQENLVFVAILRQKLPDYMSDPSDSRYQDFYFGLGNVILICNDVEHDNVQEHLGPTLSSLLTQFYTYTRSDSYQLATDVLVSHDDNSSLFHDVGWKKHSIIAKAKYASDVLADAVRKLPGIGLPGLTQALDPFLNLDWDQLDKCRIASIISDAIQCIRDSGIRLKSAFKLMMADAESTSIKLANHFSLKDDDDDD
jgi:hypothetical protein